MKQYLTEFIGTFFLVLVIALTGNPVAIGAVLMVLVYMGGHVSGAHYNPAVTLAIFFRRGINLKESAAYMGFQVLGAFAAAAAYYHLSGEMKTFAPQPDMSINVLKPLFVETIFTFILCLVVLNVATTAKTSGNQYFGLAIGFTVLAAAFAGGPISGGAFNPAVGFGPILIDTIHGGNSMSSLWIYIVGPFLGGSIAALVFRIMNPEEN